VTIVEVSNVGVKVGVGVSVGSDVCIGTGKRALVAGVVGIGGVITAGVIHAVIRKPTAIQTNLRLT
jgi:hypothetical protein